MPERVWRIYGEGGRLELEPLASSLVATIVDARRAKALEIELAASDTITAIAEIVREKPELLMDSRARSCGYYGCNRVMVPDLGIIAELALALRSVLAKAPAKPVVGKDDDGTERVAWSPEEAEAARKAAILLDIVAMLLRHPKEMLEKLPEDVELLVQKSSEGTLMDYFTKTGQEQKAEARG